MSKIRDEIESVLDKFRDVSVAMMYHQVFNDLFLVNNRLSESGEEDHEGIFEAEKTAFALHLNDDGTKCSWGTSFGPWIESTETEFPKKSSITPTLLEYWKERGLHERCFILSARYNDIIWDLSKLAEVKCSIDFPRRAVDSYLKCIMNNRFKLGMEERKYLSRARVIALQIKDEYRQLLVERLMVTRERQHAEDSKPGTWGDGFELLFKNSKSVLKNDERTDLLNDMESRLQRLSQEIDRSPSGINPNSLYYLSALLIKYYSQSEDPLNLTRVVDILTNNHIKYGSTQDPFVAHHWLTMYSHLLTDYGFSNKELGIVIQQAIQKLGPEMKRNLEEHSITEFISREVVDKTLLSLKADTLSSSLRKYGMFFFIDLEEIECSIKENLAENRTPISALLSSMYNLDHNGRIKSIIGPADDDIEGNSIIVMTRMMTKEPALLADLAMRDIIKTHNPSNTSFTNALYECSLLPNENKETIKKGVKCYLDEDYVSAIHILTPQVEACIRHRIQASNGIVYRFSKDGSEECKPLGKLLAEAERIGKYNTKLCKYLRVVLVDSRGLNIRNAVSHGLADSGFFCKTVADRLMHVLILISFIG